MIDTLWVVLGVGVFLGFFVGRWSAETFRALHDRKRIWDSRRNYRE
jgi:hypothetical protein